MDHLMTTAFSLILIVVISLQAVLFSLPFFQRMTFDAYCHQAFMLMDHEGGLTAENYSRLETDLLSHGFENPVIHGSPIADFGEEISLYVQAEISTPVMTPNMEQQTTRRQLVYENAAISRHLLTLAGEP